MGDCHFGGSALATGCDHEGYVRSVIKRRKGGQEEYMNEKYCIVVGEGIRYSCCPKDE